MSAIEFFSAFYAMHAIVVLYMESMTTSSICNLHNINILNIESRQKCLCFEHVSIFLVKIFIPKFVELLKCLNQNNSKSSWLNLNDESILSKLSLQINCPIFFLLFSKFVSCAKRSFCPVFGKIIDLNDYNELLCHNIRGKKWKKNEKHNQEGELILYEERGNNQSKARWISTEETKNPKIIRFGSNRFQRNNLTTAAISIVKYWQWRKE